MVLLRKIRRERNTWEYVVNNEHYIYQTEGELFEQFVYVVEDILTQVTEDANLVIISPTFLVMIEEQVKEFFPDILFLRLNDAAGRQAFERAFNGRAVHRRSQTHTFFIGADGSGGHANTISAWAWVANGEHGDYGMGICEFKDNNLSEFEGILRGIIDNKDVPYNRIHVYSDSSNAIQYYRAMVERNEPVAIITGTYLEELVDEVKMIASGKRITVSWVRGHRQHRLNMAADIISRHARMSVQKGMNVREMVREADALFALFNKPHIKG